MMLQKVKSIKDNLIQLIILSLVAGLLVGQFLTDDLESSLKILVTPLLFLMIYPMMVNLKIEEAARFNKHIKTILLSLLVNFIVSPVIAFVLLYTLPIGDEYMLGILLISIIPTSGMTAAWTGLAKGDLETALVAMSVNLLLGILLIPLFMSMFFPIEGTVSVSGLYKQLGIVVLLPMIAGNITRRVIVSRKGEKRFKNIKPIFGGLSSLGVILIVFVAISMRSQVIVSNPISSLVITAPVVGYYILILISAMILGKALDTDKKISLIYSTSMRNLSIAVAIVLSNPSIPNTAVLPISLAYLIQPPFGALYMHYRRDIVAEDLTIREFVQKKIDR
jgi:ACR3 family arsenite efflux pump ArsB